MVQTDCCDSIRTINDPFHYKGINNYTDALELAINSGVQVYFGFWGGKFIPAFNALLAAGRISEDTLKVMCCGVPSHNVVSGRSWACVVLSDEVGNVRPKQPIREHH